MRLDFTFYPNFPFKPIQIPYNFLKDRHTALLSLRPDHQPLALPSASSLLLLSPGILLGNLWICNLQGTPPVQQPKECWRCMTFWRRSLTMPTCMSRQQPHKSLVCSCGQLPLAWTLRPSKKAKALLWVSFVCTCSNSVWLIGQLTKLPCWAIPIGVCWDDQV